MRSSTDAGRRSGVKYRLATSLPIAAALVVYFVTARAGSPEATPAFHHVAITLAKLLAAVGAVIGAERFEPGGHLRRAWLFLGGCYVLLLFNDLALGFGSHLAQARFSTAIAVARGTTVTLANLSSVVGLWLFARAQTVAGLHFSDERGRRVLVQLLSITIALVIAGPPALHDLRAVAGGDVQLFVSLGSDLGDIVGFCLIGPLLTTTISLFGGLLGWPWALLVASQIGWLLYDAVGVFGGGVGLRIEHQRCIEEALRVLACWYSFSAGLTQRWVLRRI